VYDALDELSEKGFVEIQPGRAKKFGPVDPDAAVKRLCEFKQRQYDDELARIRRIGDQFADTIEDDSAPAERSEICWTYSNRHHILDKLAELATSATSEIRMVTTPLSFEHILNDHIEALTQAAEAGATIQAIVSEDGTIPSAIHDRAAEIMDIRFVENIEGRIYLYDHAQVLVAFAASDDDGYVGISTTSEALYETKSQLFELLWADGRVPIQRSPNSEASHPQ
jgi:sugar-specific transcriptional regulator TrmB